METKSPEPLDKKQNDNKGEFPILQLNQLIQQKSKMNFQGSICWKVFLFLSLPKPAYISKKFWQYFGLDLVEERTERTIWTHKPSVWETVFRSVQECAETAQVLPHCNMFDGILVVPVRASSTNT